MTNLVRWQPLSDALSLREAMDRLFKDSFVTPRSWSVSQSGAVNNSLDVYETDNEVVVKAALPGISRRTSRSR